MRFSKILPPLALAVLSLGFLGHSPREEAPTRRRVSSCEDRRTDNPALQLFTPTVAPAGLFSFITDDATRRTAEGYALFLNQMNLVASMYSPAAPSLYGGLRPMFPSYNLPQWSAYDVPLARPDNSGQVWDGIAKDPQLAFLVGKAPDTTVTSRTASLAAAVRLQPLQVNGTLDMTSGNRIGATKF